MAMNMMGMGMGMSTVATPQKTASALPSITPSPKSGLVPALEKQEGRDFTVPDFMVPWPYYGRIDPGCSCIITSANPHVPFSAVETDTALQCYESKFKPF